MDKLLGRSRRGKRKLVTDHGSRERQRGKSRSCARELHMRVRQHWVLKVNRELLEGAKHRLLGRPAERNNIPQYLDNSPGYNLPRRVDIKEIRAWENRVGTNTSTHLRNRSMLLQRPDGVSQLNPFGITHRNAAHGAEGEEGMFLMKDATLLVNLLVRG